MFKRDQISSSEAKLAVESDNDSVVISVAEPAKQNGNQRPSAPDMVRVARAQFNSGKTKPLEFRRKQLKNLLRMLDENGEVFQEALYQDLHRHKLESSVYDIEHSRNATRSMLMHLDKWSKCEYPRKPLMNLLDGVRIEKEPYGVVLVIAPWNFPLNLLITPACGAIAAGNCVILKPSEVSSATCQVIAELVPKYLDSECYQVFTGGVTETTALLEQRFDYIFFTGSTAVGKIIHAAANKYLTPVTLELGGKNPVYIDDTVNMDIAVQRILWGKCVNAGQICMSPDYILCSREVQEKFLAHARNKLKNWYQNDAKSSPDYSRIINSRHFERLVNFLDSSNVAIGGHVDKSELYIEPTVLTGVKPNDPIMDEEIFGPILPIVIVKDVVEAVAFINAREKPLAVYVFSKDKKTKRLMLKNTSSGAITVNDTLMSYSVETLPFGGVGNSGMGSYHGKASFDTFVHRKSIYERGYCKYYEKLFFLRYPPYSQWKEVLINLLLRPMRSIPFNLIKYVIAFILGIIAAVIYNYFVTIK